MTRYRVMTSIVESDKENNAIFEFPDGFIPMGFGSGTGDGRATITFLISEEDLARWEAKKEAEAKLAEQNPESEPKVG